MRPSPHPLEQPVRSPQRTIPSLSLLLGLTLALTSCANGTDDGSAAEPAAGPAAANAANTGFTEPEDPYAVTDPELSERLHLPLYDYMLDEYEQWTVRRAQDALAVECLTGLGYDVSAAPYGTADVLLAHFGPRHEYRRYGVARVDLAEEYGFEVPEEEPGDPYLYGEGVDEEAVFAALHGFPAVDSTPSGEPVPEGGCNHQANLRLNPDSPPPDEEGMWVTPEGGAEPDLPGVHPLALNLTIDSYSAGEQDPEVVAAAGAWKECMDLAADAAGPVGASEATGDAVRTARCLDSSGFLDAFVAAETRAQEPMIEEHREALEERRDRLAEELAAAREALGW
ncbi:hypothetical protein [Nocardiopsis protaetiae]|uniref:hypothetical protein n=2 Tax=Nocardiopsis protaetiae TaxID=3382270 RepID=UPI00387B7B02